MIPTREAVSRCLALIPLLREAGDITLEELAQRAQIPAEQIAGELGTVLLMCGVPPYFPHDYIGFSIESGRVAIRFADQFERPISLTPLEALALRLACEGASPPGEELPPGVAALLRKVEEGMARDQRELFRNLARRVSVREADAAGSGFATRAALAVAERRAVRITYVASGRPVGRERVIHPYGLISRDGHWYLIARDLIRQDVVPFRLDRVQHLEATDEHFEIPADFRLDRHATGPFVAGGAEGPIARVRLFGSAARWVKESASSGTLTDELESGSVLWHVPQRDPDSLARFVIRLGDEARVEHPPELAEAVRRLARAVAAAHA